MGLGLSRSGGFDVCNAYRETKKHEREFMGKTEVKGEKTPPIHHGELKIYASYFDTKANIFGARYRFWGIKWSSFLVWGLN
jgi:hypothetical protein